MNTPPNNPTPPDGGSLPRRVRPSGRVLCRFSCGAASAVATKLAIEKYGTVEINYSDTGSEHPDNARFIADCERWFGQKVTITKSEKYRDIWEVFEKKRFLVSHHGAPCTAEMKRRPGDSVWSIGDTEIFGYTADERHRVVKWSRDNFERIIECPLIEKNLTKQDCFGILDRVGIELPAMYRLGFRNNNCIGCVKARDNLDYWKRVRKHFPSIFERMAKLERDIGTTINRITKNGERSPIFLDEIEEGDPKGADPNIQCGLFCMAEADAMIDGPNKPDIESTEPSAPPARAACIAQWTVELNCDCPKCGEYVNLLDAPDFWDGRKLEIAEHDTANSNDLEVQCPECGHEFNVCCQW